MRKFYGCLGLVFLAVSLVLPVLADGFEASLDRNDITVPMGLPAVLKATLRNQGPKPIYVTGVKVLLSDGASGSVYNPELLHDRLFKLDPGQSWGGPLAVIHPNHRGSLFVKGSILLNGGSTEKAEDTLASLPFQLMINDPNRKVDGSYERGTLSACDRSSEPCCDASETSCFHIADRCIYVADGYNRQAVCIDQKAEKSYEQIADLRVSSDAAHFAYLASSQCVSDGPEERCQRTVVVDHVEHKGPEVPTQLQLSPDGQHYAYIGRASCVTILHKEKCTGSRHPVVDGVRVESLPAWYQGESTVLDPTSEKN